MTRLSMRTLLLLSFALASCQTDAPADTTIEPVADDPVVASTIERLNLNTATEDELKALGIGDRMAHEFDEYRPYSSLRVFREEIGKYIDDDPVQLAEYERMVFVPVDPEASDAETLQQLPNLDASGAQALIDGRPYASDQAFLDAYLVAAPTGDIEQARSFLQ